MICLYFFDRSTSKSKNCFEWKKGVKELTFQGQVKRNIKLEKIKLYYYNIYWLLFNCFIITLGAVVE